jgi:putative component of toxin-antitoxin plasmid stabilization module
MTHRPASRYVDRTRDGAGGDHERTGAGLVEVRVEISRGGHIRPSADHDMIGT